MIHKMCINNSKKDDQFSENPSIKKKKIKPVIGVVHYY